MSRINVTRPSMPLFDEYIEELRKIWESRWLSNRGETAIRFEDELKKYFHCDRLWLFANGHTALETALQALSINKNSCIDKKSEIITTPYTFVSTTEAIVRNGFKPVFVDVREDNLTIDPLLIEKSITQNTIAIVATHVYGFMCDVFTIERIAKKHNLIVIYDAAHAFGVKYNDISVANYGDAVMFSTHATKVFHTIEGGILTYKDENIFGPVKKLINFGFDGEEDVKYIGENGKMNEFEAAMGICNLRHIDDEIAKRKKINDYYTERLRDVAGIKLLQPTDALEWNYAYYPVIFDGYKETRDEIKTKLETENIFVRKYFYPITTQLTCFADDYGNINLPVAKYASKNILSLPMYADLSIEDVERICNIILR